MPRKSARSATLTSTGLLCYAAVWLIATALANFPAILRGQEAISPVVPLPHAHAHNDYHHDRPLVDSLQHGFCSVEADVFLVDGALLVGHESAELTPERTLQALYLDPLRTRVKSNGGRVYRGGPTFLLLIDVKSDGRETYEALHKVLGHYAEMFTSVHEGEVRLGAVTAVVSGNRDSGRIAADSTRYAGIDGRLSDLESELSPHLMPLISDNWQTHFQWRGQGPIPADEREKLRTIVRRAHAAGRRVRLWATPEDTAVWDELVQAGVDLINTDDLDGLRRYFLQQNWGD